MKLTVLLTLFACLQIKASVYSQQVSLSVKKAPLERVIKEIRKQTGYAFFYDAAYLKSATPVSIEVRQASINEVLTKVFEGQKFTWEVLDNTIVIKPSYIKENRESISIVQSTIDIKGRVVDEKGAPLPGASINVKGTTIGGATDANGEFLLRSIDPQAVLVISHMGYNTQEIAVSNQKEMLIKLLSVQGDLDEVVVVGYGRTQKKDLTGSVSVLQTSKVKDLPVASIEQRLVGQMPGVQITTPTGTPGGGGSVRIRGIGSITAGNDPLYVVDGFAISNSSGQVYNPLNSINPDDIESVSVLKDASSTAIYGSRGSNGVIVITTKRGKVGTPVVSINTYLGSQQVPQKGRPQVLNGTEYAQFRKEMIIDDFAARGLVAKDDDIPVEFRNPEQYGEGTDWYDAVLRNAFQNNIDVSIRGGSESTRYSASAGRLQQQGVIRYTDYERYTVNFNIESDITKKLKLGLSVNPTGGIQNRNSFETGIRDVLTRTLWLSPIVPVTDAQGNRTVFITSPGAIGAGNPLNTLEFAGTEAKYFRGMGSAFAEYEILDGLKAKYSFNYDYNNSSSFAFSPDFVYGETSNPNPQPPIPSSSTGQNTRSNWLSELTLSYDKTFGDHRFDAVAGYTAQKERYDGYSFGATNYPDNLIETINAATLLQSPGASVEKWSLISYLARLNYTWKDKYLLTGTFRADGSSRFGANNRYGYFPSGAFAWRVSQEEFMKQVRWIDDLKLRVSYGSTGNFNISNYQYASNVDASNYAFGNSLANGRVSSSLANPDLTWEKAQEFDAGIDLSILGSRINIVADYYNRITSSLLLNAELPFASGFGSATVNLGRVRNRGFEFAVTSQNMTGDFTWTTNANISFNRNIVLALNPANDHAPMYSGRSGGGYFTHKTEVGKPIGQFYGFVFDGLYRTQEELDTQPKDGNSVLGSVRYKDIDGNGIIEAVKDFDVIGNSQPDFTFGLTNNFGYKNFDLNIIVVGSQGGQLMKTGNEFLYNTDGVFNVDRIMLNRWRSPENPGDGRTPTTVGGRVNYREVSSLWIEDASFLRIQNIALGYNLNPTIFGGNGFIKSLRIYSSIQNLITWTKYSGANPEAGTNDGFSALMPGRDFTSYPVPRIITGGINLTF